MSRPPAVWQREVAQGKDEDQCGVITAQRTGVYESDDKISDTWRHIKQVAREGSKDYDLLDLLQNTRREDTYQFPVPGVSALVCG